jgi:PTS system nitrogen regulatory IIA component
MDETVIGLAGLLERGGVFRDIEGNTSREVLTGLIKALPPVPPVSPETLLQAVLEREALMSTGIGRGIAIPHPRNPVITAAGGQFTALASLKNPVDWNSLDGERVDTLLLIVSASAKQHLHALSEITFFSRQENFCRLLRERAPLEEILRFIREAEGSWKHQA